LGDVGILRDYVYVRVRSLREYGIDFRARIERGTGSLQYASAGSVSSEFKLAGQLPPAGSMLSEAQAGVVVSFNAENTFFFFADGYSTSSIEDQKALADGLLALRLNGDWPDDYVVVTEVVLSERTTILASSASGGQIELSADASAGAGIGDIFSGSAGLRALRAQNMALQVVAEGGLTPLFRAWGIKRRFLGRPTLVRRGVPTPQPVAAETGLAPASFDEVDYEEFR
jgi:hypothetical protein